MADAKASGHRVDLVDHILEQDFGDGPEMRLSLQRLSLVLLVVAGLVFAGFVAVRNVLASTPKLQQTSLIPYVDATNTPLYNFQDPSANLTGQVALGFVVAQDRTSCTPSWGGAYSLSEAEGALNLSRRIAQYRDIGGKVIVSFGGQAGTDLAAACPSSTSLKHAYDEVLTTYRTTEIDLDIEGTMVSNTAAVTRAAVALASLQGDARRATHHLGIWVTLPVGEAGLTSDGTRVVNIMLSHHVALAGVNALAMDYGSRLPGSSMVTTIESSLSGTETQLATLFANHHMALSTAQVWNRMGATVMIGVNDSAGEQVTIGDALSLKQFVAQNHLGRISFWSLNRDSQCGSNFAVLATLSTTCSGVPQRTLQFSSIFNTLGAAGSSPSAPLVTSTTVPPNAKGPYPTWESQEAYPTGYLVTWHGSVYVARYYSQGLAPDTPVQYSWQSAWELIGPVLPGESAPTVTTLPPGTKPAWSPLVGYPQGSEVLYNGLPYVALFYNQDTSPGAAAVAPQYSPWKPLWSYPNEPSTNNG